jgi:hypothetical protein
MENEALEGKKGDEKGRSKEVEEVMIIDIVMEFG